MTHADQLGTYELEQLRLQLQRITHLVMTEPCYVTSSLYVRTQVKNVHQHLHVSLSLLVTTMLAGHEQRRIVLHHQDGRERVVWSLLRRNDIGTLRIECEESTPVM